MYKYLVYFLIFSFLGWCAEVLFCAVKEGRYVNRGLARGPVCPIYGVGLCLCRFLLGSVKSAPLLFLFSMSVATAVEFVTGVVSERITGRRLWDYGDIGGNILGYVCPAFSVLWGLVCTLVLRALPLVDPYVTALEGPLGYTVFGVLFLLVLIDILFTSLKHRKMKNSV